MNDGQLNRVEWVGCGKFANNGQTSTEFDEQKWLIACVAFDINNKNCSKSYISNKCKERGVKLYQLLIRFNNIK